MLSILPELRRGALPAWAYRIRDEDENWMLVAQKGVEAFTALAMRQGIPFATETVFSYWQRGAGGRIRSKVDKIRRMQRAGYFVLLIFVGLSDVRLSIGRVATRVASGGHGVSMAKLLSRFPRTQAAIGHAASVADATIMTDNSRHIRHAFAVARVQMHADVLFDCRDRARPPRVMRRWLDVVSPR